MTAALWPVGMAASAALSAVTRIGLHEESFELSDKIISLNKSGPIEDKLCTVTGDDVCQMLLSDGYLSPIYRISLKYGCSLANTFYRENNRQPFCDYRSNPSSVVCLYLDSFLVSSTYTRLLWFKGEGWEGDCLKEIDHSAVGRCRYCPHLYRSLSHHGAPSRTPISLKHCTARALIGAALRCAATHVPDCTVS